MADVVISADNEKVAKVGVPRDVARRFRRAVELRHMGNTYRNMGHEMVRALEAHIKVMERETRPELRKRY